MRTTMEPGVAALLLLAVVGLYYSELNEQFREQIIDPSLCIQRRSLHCS